MRLIDADAFKKYIKDGYEENKEIVKSGFEQLAKDITEGFLWDIDEQPTVSVFPSSHEWISCDEKLPEKPDTYIATIDYGKQGLGVGQRYYHGGYLGWNDDCVIAWMPLPEPYKGDDK